MEVRAACLILASYLVALCAAGIAFAALHHLSSAFAVFTAVLIFIGAAVTGVNAAAALIMDRARGVSSRSLREALDFGVRCVPKILVIAGVAGAVALVAFLSIALVLFLCKMAGSGPVLLALVSSLSALLGGLILIGLMAGVSLLFPAIWEGASCSQALLRLKAIARARPVEALAFLFGAYAIAAVAALTAALVFWVGFLPVSGLAAWIAVAAPSISDGSDLIFGHSPSGGFGWAGMLSALLLLAFAGTLVLHVLLFALDLVYLHLIEGLDPAFEARDAALRVKARAARAQRSAGPLLLRPAVAATAIACSVCGSVVSTQDAFCEHCGHKLS